MSESILRERAKEFAKNCKYYCPYVVQYNKLHSNGDICEILIGSDANRKQYYEIKLSPTTRGKFHTPNDYLPIKNYI